MPRKMSGSAISTIEELMVTISTPSVVLDRAIHLYREPVSVGSRRCLAPGLYWAPGWTLGRALRFLRDGQFGLAGWRRVEDSAHERARQRDPN